MAPSAPPLTREEFVSLRDGAKGLMHRIPSEHKARLIELGYIEDAFWRHSIDERWQDEDCGRLTDLKWPKCYFPLPDLRRRALAEVRQQAGCRNVQDIAINRVTDERAENNWSLCVLSAGAADANTAARAALYVQGVLRRDYNLMAD